MGIPRTQLERWSHQGAVTNAQKTHESIRHALESSSALEGVSYKVFLQGSYKNDTNIRGDSDVDAVVLLKDVFYHNLPPYDVRRQLFQPSTYSWHHFRNDVLKALRGYYGSLKVEEGSKAFKVQTPYLRADVVVSARYLYYDLSSSNPNDYEPGITFWTSEGRQVINFPEQHYQNGVEKNRRTEGNYKKVVRIFKNARSYLADSGMLARGVAPSYFLECLLYNVPDDIYKGTFSEVFPNIVRYLYSALNDNQRIRAFVCQNGLVALFGDTPEQWNVNSAMKLVESLWNLWYNWELYHAR